MYYIKVHFFTDFYVEMKQRIQSYVDQLLIILVFNIIF